MPCTKCKLADRSPEYKTWCKPCGQAYHRTRYHNKYKGSYRRNYHLQANYGISLEEFNDLAEGGCALCGKFERLVADHDHTTNKFRGVLCHWCNIFLGHTKDSVEFLQRCADYLTEERSY